MRRVTSGSAVWRKPGVGSTDIAALVGCSPEADDGPLTLWAKIVQKQERKALGRMKKFRLVQKSDEWLDWRQKGVGGSECAAVVSANPYDGNALMKLWGQKLPKDHPEWQPPTPTNEAMKYGQQNEPGARDLYQELMGFESEDVCVIHDLYDHVRCSLDGWNEDRKIVLEIKCPKNPSNHYKNLAVSRIDDPLERQRAYNQISPHYLLQVQYQMLICEAKCCHFVSFKPEIKNPNDRFCVMTLWPQPDEQERLLNRVNEFWDYVVRRQPPPSEWLIPDVREPVNLLISE